MHRNVSMINPLAVVISVSSNASWAQCSTTAFWDCHSETGGGEWELLTVLSSPNTRSSGSLIFCFTVLTQVLLRMSLTKVHAVRSGSLSCQKDRSFQPRGTRVHDADSSISRLLWGYRIRSVRREVCVASGSRSAEDGKTRVRRRSRAYALFVHSQQPNTTSCLLSPTYICTGADPGCALQTNFRILLDMMSTLKSPAVVQPVSLLSSPLGLSLFAAPVNGACCDTHV
jgi:hypothetical protein